MVEARREKDAPDNAVAKRKRRITWDIQDQNGLKRYTTIDGRRK